MGHVRWRKWLGERSHINQIRWSVYPTYIDDQAARREQFGGKRPKLG